MFAPRRTHDGFEETIGVNHLGHFALVRDLLPCMRRGSRVAVTSSCVHDPASPDGRNGATPTLGDLAGMEAGDFSMCDGGAFDGNKAYKDSKLCNVLFAREKQRCCRAAGVVVSAFSPRFVPSSGLFRAQSAPVRAMLKALMFDHPPLATTVENAGRFTTQMVLGKNTGEMSGAYLCGPPSFDVPGEDAHPLGGGFLRGWFRPEFGVKRPSEEALDAALGEKLWAISERLVEEVYARASSLSGRLQRRRVRAGAGEDERGREARHDRRLGGGRVWRRRGCDDEGPRGFFYDPPRRRRASRASEGTISAVFRV